jgi:hypothetical protein
MTKTSAPSGIEAIIDALGVEVEKPIRMPLLHPETQLPLVDAESGEPAYFDVLNPNSPQIQAEEKARSRARGKPPTNETQDQKDAREEKAFFERLSTMIRGWNLVTLEGKKIDVPFSAENALAVLQAPSLYPYRNQLMQFASETANFLRNKPSA